MSNAQEFRIDQKIHTVVNPCPKIEDREVSKRSEIREPKDRGIPEFRVELYWDARKQIVVLDPQEKISVADYFADALSRDFAHEGIFLLDPEQDEIDQRIRALQRASDHYRTYGAEQLALLHEQYDEKQMKRLRSQFKGQYRNEMREQILQEEIERLEKLSVVPQGEVDEPLIEPEAPPLREGEAVAPCGKVVKANYMNQHVKLCHQEGCLRQKDEVMESGASA